MAATSLSAPRRDSSLPSPELQSVRSCKFTFAVLPFSHSSNSVTFRSFRSLSPHLPSSNRRFSSAIRSESSNGADRGGIRASRFAASFGTSVAVCELPFSTISSETTVRNGGTYVLRGCVPKRRLLYASKVSHEFEESGGFGWNYEAKLTHDWRTKTEEIVTIRTPTREVRSTPLEIVGGIELGWHKKENSKLSSTLESVSEDFDWAELEADLYHWTRSLRPVQWYPGHIAKTEKELKEQLKLMDVVIEVRDARIPMSTSHPQMDSWLGNRKRIIVLNREDMISRDDRNSWANYYARQGTRVVFANGKLGMGSMKLSRLVKALAGGVNTKRKAKGLLPRPVRAGIVGYPNVGKSSLINRLLKRRMCKAAARPGVTRELRWVRFGEDLELLDSPGMIPMRIDDQSAAIKLAICDDIGEKSYDVSEVAAILVQMLATIPAVGYKALYGRYKIEADGHVGKTFVQKLALQLFNGDNHQAAFRILSDFRKGKFGWYALERPPSCKNVEHLG